MNSCRLGSTFSREFARRYRVPPSCLTAGTNELRVRVADTGGSGGIVGAASDVALELNGGRKKISLSGVRRIFSAGALPGLPDHPGNERTTPALLYNGMIEPFSGERFDALYGIKGNPMLMQVTRLRATQ